MTIKRKNFEGKREYDVDGEAGNAYAILGTAQSTLRQMGVTATVQKRVLAEMRSGDYANLVATFDFYFGSIYDVVTENDELREEVEEARAKRTGYPDFSDPAVGEDLAS